MSGLRIALPALLLVLGQLAAFAEQTRQPDPEAAEREYRLARRLAAERSPRADEALARVVELDPNGARADDALVDRALLLGIAEWPEEIGRVSPEDAARAQGYLDTVLERLPRGDRAGQAALLAALLRLEPLAPRIPSELRADMLGLATTRGVDDEIGRRARLAAGRLDEIVLAPERAHAAYLRLALDDDGTEAALRARVGLGRLALLEGRFEEAAASFQAAVEAGAPAETGVRALRELAVRSALRLAGAGGRWADGSPSRADVGIRSPGGLARTRDEGLVIADRRQGLLHYVDGRTGQFSDRSVPGLRSVVVDGPGRVIAVTDEGLEQVTAAASRPLGALGEFGPVSAVAADGAGRVWVADRRGGRVGVLEPGRAQPVETWSSEERRIGGLAWDGRRLVALDARTDTLFVIDGDGGESGLAPGLELQNPVWVAAAFGQVAVLDTRRQEVVLLGPGGTLLETLDYRAAGIERPLAVALGANGGLDVLAADGGWWRFP